MADTGPIIEFIEKAGLVDGQRLPAERELAVALQLSRGTVRRMLEKLETEGRIWRHVGRGTFLGRPELASSGEQLQGDVTSEIHPAEVLEARLILEPPVAALAAHRATSAQLESMQRVVSGGAAATSFETFEKLDAAFHEAVVKAAQNKLISYLYATIAKSRDQVVWGQMKRASVTAQRRRRYQSSHEAISLAILDRDAKLAEREMRAHLLEVRANMLGT